MAVLRHPLAFRLGHHLIVHGLVFPLPGNHIASQPRLVVAGAGLADPSVVFAVVLFQPIIIHGSLGRPGAVGAFQIQRIVSAFRLDGRVHGRKRVGADLPELLPVFGGNRPGDAALAFPRNGYQILRDIAFVQLIVFIGQDDEGGIHVFQGNGKGPFHIAVGNRVQIHILDDFLNDQILFLSLREDGERKEQEAEQQAADFFQPKRPFQLFSGETEGFPRGRKATGWGGDQLFRRSPQKNSATVPGPVCAPMVHPIGKSLISPRIFGNFSRTSWATAWASSRQSE